MYFTVPLTSLLSQSHPPPPLLPSGKLSHQSPLFLPGTTSTSISPTLKKPSTSPTASRRTAQPHPPSSPSLLGIQHHPARKHCLRSPLRGHSPPLGGDLAPDPLPSRRAPILPPLPLSLRSRYSAASSSRWMLIIWTRSMAGGLGSPGPPSAPAPAAPLDPGAAAAGRRRGPPSLPGARASSHRPGAALREGEGRQGNAPGNAGGRTRSGTLPPR